MNTFRWPDCIKGSVLWYSDSFTFKSDKELCAKALQDPAFDSRIPSCTLAWTNSSCKMRSLQNILSQHYIIWNVSPEFVRGRGLHNSGYSQKQKKEGLREYPYPGCEIQAKSPEFASNPELNNRAIGALWKSAISLSRSSAYLEFPSWEYHKSEPKNPEMMWDLRDARPTKAIVSLLVKLQIRKWVRGTSPEGVIRRNRAWNLDRSLTPGDMLSSREKI
jgi:hypothetical protein